MRPPRGRRVDSMAIRRPRFRCIKQVLSLQPSNNTALGRPRRHAVATVAAGAGAPETRRVRETPAHSWRACGSSIPGHVGLPDAQAALTQARDKQRARGDTRLARQATRRGHRRLSVGPSHSIRRRARRATTSRDWRPHGRNAASARRPISIR
jgi:hypothetical protein